MTSEIDILNRYIDENFKSKAAFAKGLGMTPQNLNHHIREAKKNKNKFSGDFMAKLEYAGYFVFRKPTSDFASTVNEPEVLYKKLLESKEETIKELRENNLLLKQQLEKFIDLPVDVGKTGGRRT